MSFDGSSKYVDLSQQITGYPFTLAAWIKPASLQVGPVLSISSSTTALEYAAIYLINDGTVRAQISRDSGAALAASAANAYAASVWTHVAAVFISSTSREVYVNGSARGANTDSKGFPDLVNASRIGSIIYLQTTLQQAWYSGLQDDQRIYNRALHSEEIRLLARYRGIAYTPARRVIYGGENLAVTARPWLYRRSTRMIGA